MTRSTSNVYLITPQYPYSFPRDPESVQSSCAMDVLIPAGQTIFVKNYQSSLPTNTVLGVCGNSIHIALPRTVIDSTYCTEMGEITNFTGDFQIRFYGTWTDEASGAVLHITGTVALSHSASTTTSTSTFKMQYTETNGVSSKFNEYDKSLKYELGSI